MGKVKRDLFRLLFAQVSSLKDALRPYAFEEMESIGTRVGGAMSFDRDYLLSVEGEIARLSVAVNDQIRRVKARTDSISRICSWDDKDVLTIHVMDNRAPWRQTPVANYEIPGMISNEEKEYYSYIGRFYSGKGKVLELGPWLGASTHYINDGLRGNPNFATEKLHVVDDFVWRSSWMDSYVSGIDRLPNHADFSHLFRKYTRDIADRLIVRRNRLALYDGNDNVPLFQWTEDPIEIIYADCGRTFEANESWYRMLHRYFIPEVTLIIMQDWRLHREIPARWYNQTKQFTDAKGEALQLVHEVNDGGIATFLWRGQR
jgi:hypothetical protein